MTGNLVRKNHLLSPAQVEKVAHLARSQRVSAGEIVRRAIDAYPGAATSNEEIEALGMLSAMLRQTIGEIEQAREELRGLYRRLTDAGREDEVRRQAREAIGQCPELVAALRRLLGGGLHEVLGAKGPAR
ncbi:MAG: hypothetical protein L0H63_09350 [Nitrococcus sp.]|nr:hypothetical protein [Nitrococcus sp.]